jgi:hypothetical protein
VFKVIEGAAYSFDAAARWSARRADLRTSLTIDVYRGQPGKRTATTTARTIAERNATAGGAPPEYATGAVRWSNLKVSHELYNVGHLYEAAAARFQATGKRTLLQVALKNADRYRQRLRPPAGFLLCPAVRRSRESGWSSCFW